VRERVSSAKWRPQRRPAQARIFANSSRMKESTADSTIGITNPPKASPTGMKRRT
jgi:hypothetical protein